MSNNKEVKGKHLNFISRILRDGSGVEPCQDMTNSDEHEYTLTYLSMTLGTYIARGFNSYVVRIKEPSKDKCLPCDRGVRVRAVK